MTTPCRSNRFLPVIATVFCAVVVSFSSPHARAAGGVFDAISQEVQQVFEKSSPAVVKVRAFSGLGPLAGTGFFIDDQGTLITSFAVVRDAKQAWIEYNGEKLEAQILGRDPRSSVALLKVQTGGKTPYLEFADGPANQLKIASALISVAYPYDLPASPSFGLVTGFNPSYLNQFFATTHVRASLDVSPGQIGGPVMNTKGEVVGMIMLAIDKTRECFILPASAAEKIIGDLKTYGEARHGWVGVGVAQDRGTVMAAAYPVKVSQLFQETPAAQSGIQPGDHVVEVAGKPIRQPSDVLDVAFFAKVGAKIPVVVERDGKLLTYGIEVIERPASSSMVEPMPAMLAGQGSKQAEPIQVKLDR